MILISPLPFSFDGPPATPLSKSNHGVRRHILSFCGFLGFPFSFGVFQNYYNSHEPFAGQPSIVVIGTSSMGVMYLTSPIIMGLGQIFGRWTRWMPLLGLVIMSLALALSSFATTTTHLILSQGILYGLGGGITYCPCIVVSFVSTFTTPYTKVILASPKNRVVAGKLSLTDGTASTWASGSSRERG